MPIQYARDSARGWLLTTASGLVTFDDINQHLGSVGERIQKLNGLGYRLVDGVDGERRVPAHAPVFDG